MTDDWSKFIRDIPEHSTFSAIEPLTKGWSSDKKFLIETADGRRLQLRISDIDKYERRDSEFKLLNNLAQFDIPASRPVDFGICNSGKSVYQLLTWIDGADAETLLPSLSEMEQFELGMRAGKILRKIHTIPAPDNIGAWIPRFEERTYWITRQYFNYRDRGLAPECAEIFFRYVESHMDALVERRQSCLHGDYHAGNLMIDKNDALSVIDWNLSTYGDPWGDFIRTSFSAEISFHFVTGQVYGYFGKAPPVRFWRLLALYVALNQIEIIWWHRPDGRDSGFLERQHRNTRLWYKDMQRLVPIWYLEEFITCYKNHIYEEEILQMSLEDEIRAQREEYQRQADESKKAADLQKAWQASGFSPSSMTVQVPIPELRRLFEEVNRYLRYDVRMTIGYAPDGTIRARCDINGTVGAFKVYSYCGGKDSPSWDLYFFPGGRIATNIPEAKLLSSINDYRQAIIAWIAKNP